MEELLAAVLGSEVLLRPRQGKGPPQRLCSHFSLVLLFEVRPTTSRSVRPTFTSAIDLAYLIFRAASIWNVERLLQEVVTSLSEFLFSSLPWWTKRNEKVSCASRKGYERSVCEKCSKKCQSSPACISSVVGFLSFFSFLFLFPWIFSLHLPEIMSSVRLWMEANCLSPASWRDCFVMMMMMMMLYCLWCDDDDYDESHAASMQISFPLFWL